MDPVDAAILTMSEAAGGHVTRRALVELGLSPKAIRHRCGRGFLIPVHRGVYAVGRRPRHPMERAAGALLAGGPGAALAGTAAAAAWGMVRHWPRQLELLTPLNRRPAGLIMHRITTPLLPADLVRLEGVLVTSRALTVLWLARGMEHGRLVRLVNTQRIDHDLPLAALHDVLSRFPRHPGYRPLADVVYGAPDEPFRSDWEFEWPPYAAEHGLPEYDMNTLVCGHRVDVRFRREGVIVQLDGWQAHGTKAAFEADREIANEILARTGMPTVRITHTQFHREPRVQAQRLHLILARRRGEPVP